MLKLVIPEQEWFDDRNQTFTYVKGCVLQLEHSLVSLSKWEQKWKKPFLGKDNKSLEEVIDYIRCMTITQNVPPEVYLGIPRSEILKVEKYINEPMTATTFSKRQETINSREIITSEIIYYWMIVHNIPMECQKWHLDRLMTLIRVCNIKSQPAKKQNRRTAMEDRASLNNERRRKMQTRG